MQVRVIHDIDDLHRDMKAIVRRAPRDMVRTVRDGVRAGNMLAQDNARRTATPHGKLYPRAFGWEMRAGFGLFGNTYSGEYGPDANKPQGGMSFERGSRNQPPHWDLAKSADVVGPVLAQEVRGLLDEWFW